MWKICCHCFRHYGFCQNLILPRINNFVFLCIGMPWSHEIWHLRECLPFPRFPCHFLRLEKKNFTCMNLETRSCEVSNIHICHLHSPIGILNKLRNRSIGVLDFNKFVHGLILIVCFDLVSSKNWMTIPTDICMDDALSRWRFRTEIEHIP